MFEMEIILFMHFSNFPISEGGNSCLYRFLKYNSSCICRLSKGAGIRRLSIVLSILDVIKHRIHVWYKMYNLKTKAEVNVPSLHPVLGVSVIVADSPSDQ